MKWNARAWRGKFANGQRGEIKIGDWAMRDPRSAIRNPQSVIRDPRCAIRDPRSVIRDPRSAIHNPQSAIRNPQSAIKYVPSHGNRAGQTVGRGENAFGRRVERTGTRGAGKKIVGTYAVEIVASARARPRRCDFARRAGSENRAAARRMERL